jgi:pyruvate ferredoxin oxidoreductase delta subunit
MSQFNTPAKDIHETLSWNELTQGGAIYEGGTSAFVNTGDWRTNVPTFLPEKCTQCLLCAPACPDSSIPVSDGKREDFDFVHCKGCGICYRVCPFGAITFGKEEK